MEVGQELLAKEVRFHLEFRFNRIEHRSVTKDRAERRKPHGSVGAEASGLEAAALWHDPHARKRAKPVLSIMGIEVDGSSSEPSRAPVHSRADQDRTPHFAAAHRGDAGSAPVPVRRIISRPCANL
jgi:hypothetical protein